MALPKTCNYNILSLLFRVTYHLRWYVYWDDMLVNMFGCPDFVNRFIRWPARLYQSGITKKHGMGGKTDEEVNNMLVEDLRRFSDILGEIIIYYAFFHFGAIRRLSWTGTCVTLKIP